MNITTRTGLSLKSSRATVRPSTAGRRKSGQGLPRGMSRLSVSAMRPQVAPRSVRGKASRLAQETEERGAVTRQLRRSDPRHGEEAGFVGRAHRGHAGEDGVAEDDVGGHVLVVGDASAKGPQALEEIAVRFGEHDGAAWSRR